MTIDVNELILRARAGDLGAQRELAIRLHEGDGIPRDETASHFWLKQAAEGGDAWAQTTYAIVLRSSGEPLKESESVRWFSLAAEQGDERARTNLAAHQFQGLGTKVDFESAAINLIMASLSGSEDARTLFEKVKVCLHEDDWERIMEGVRWADLTFLLGPAADGHLSELFGACRNGSEEAEAIWLQYEKEVAEECFLRHAVDRLIFPPALFGVQIVATEISVARAVVQGERVAATTISLRNFRQVDGKPVWWKPNKEILDALAATIGFSEGRQWVRWAYSCA